MAQRNVVARSGFADDADRTGADGTSGADAAAGPSVCTVILLASNRTTTVPLRSVLSTLAPDAASRSSVALAGWP